VSGHEKSIRPNRQLRPCGSSSPHPHNGRPDYAEPSEKPARAGRSPARRQPASAHGYNGDGDEGPRHLEVSNLLSPRDLNQALSLSSAAPCHFVAGRYADSIAANRRAVRLRPRFTSAWRTLAAAASISGDLELGKSSLLEAKRLQPDLSARWVEAHLPFVRPDDANGSPRVCSKLAYSARSFLPPPKGYSPGCSQSRIGWRRSGSRASVVVRPEDWRGGIDGNGAACCKAELLVEMQPHRA
jgi:hypothetical protein